MSRINGLKWQVCSIMACTGLLSSCGGASEGGGGPAFAYIANEGTLTAYSINSSSGGLTGSAGSPLMLPHSVDPMDRFVYVVNYGSATLSEFMLDSSGALTPLAGSPATVVSNPSLMDIVWN